MTQVVGNGSLDCRRDFNRTEIYQMNRRNGKSWKEFGPCACGKKSVQRFTSKEEAAHFKAKGPLEFHCASCKAKDKRQERREMVGLCLRLEARRAEIREEQRKR